MTKATQLRLLRLKYGVSLDLLAKKVGITNQTMSKLELAQVPVRPWQEDRFFGALSEVIADRQTVLYDFERELLLHKGHLLTPMEVESDEF